MDEVVATGRLNGLERDWWTSIKSSPLLADKRLGSFLGLENSKARRNLLYEASELEDGTYAIKRGKAQVLADALFALLSLGALARGRGALGHAQ